MTSVCPRCGKSFDMVDQWTICPHATRPIRALPLPMKQSAHASRTPVRVNNGLFSMEEIKAL